MKDLIKPRTLIAFLLYGTFSYLAITGAIKPDAVIAVISVLMGFFYGERSKNDKNNKILP